MSEILSSLQYTETHEWVRLDDKQTVVIGLTSHAQQQLGDVVFVVLLAGKPRSLGVSGCE